jgi:hypothetical protein
MRRPQRVNSFLNYSNAARPWPTNGRRQHRLKIPPFEERFLSVPPAACIADQREAQQRPHFVCWP